MLLLITGLLLWSIIHLIPSMEIGIRKALVNKLGENGYSAIFSLIIIASLVLIIFGWRNNTPTALYTLPDLVRQASTLLVVVALMLFGASLYPTRIKSHIRHPQLTGVLLWSVAHLLMNGDTRSVVLFVGLALWALVEMFFISRRDGEWKKPEPPSWKMEITGGVIAAIVVGVVSTVHSYLSGVAIF